MISFEGIEVKAQHAASALYGRIVDYDSGEGIPGVHIYLAGTQKGTVSEPDGAFKFNQIGPGSHQLVATSISYQKEVVDFTIGGTDSLFYEIELKKAVYEINSITVEAEADRDWRKNFRRFKEYFLGRSPNAARCEIQNPYTLDFNATPFSLEATAKEPLIVINEALGYSITFSLTHFLTSELGFQFRGEPFFEVLSTNKKRQQKRWVDAREKAYHGSLLHFLRASAAGNVYDEGFRTYLFGKSYWRNSPTKFRSRTVRESAGIAIAELVSPQKNGYEFTLDFEGFLHIVYEDERVDRDFMHDMQMAYKNNGAPQISVLESTEGPVVFNEAGYLNAVYGVARYGYWNWESGLCDMLPYDYGDEVPAQSSQ